jgi:hypothetical protein
MRQLTACQVERNFVIFRQARGMFIWELNPMSRAHEFRSNADECRQQAEKAINPLDKERWLKIAEHWLLMAQEEDTRGTGGGR